MRESDMQARNKRNWRRSVERWQSPCGVDVTSLRPQDKYIMSQSQILPQYQKIWSRARETRERVANLKRLFVSNSIILT